jgi:hypothetical protein
VNDTTTLEGMIAQVKLIPGWTMYPPHMDALGDRVDIARQVAEATGTVVEWTEGGSPRFMPKDEALAELIRVGWRRIDLDVESYAPPKTGGVK